MLPTFVTGNLNKVNYLRNTLGFELPHHKVDLTEIQSDKPRVVVESKAREAFSILQTPVLIEDTSLFFNALGNLPGPLVKFFVEMPGDGLEKMCRMLDGFEDRSAYGTAMYGYFDGTQFASFAGRLNGVIAQHPRGSGGYGWDAVFEPDGYDGLTRAELSPEQDLETYSQLRDIESLQKFLGGLAIPT